MKDAPRLKDEYDNKIRKELLKELKVDNIMEVPRLSRIVISTGVGEAVADRGVLEPIERDIAAITGQKPVKCIARKAVAGFKIRKGDVIGLKVTLRGRRMWEFFDKLISVVFPRTKDFQGLSPKSFDGSGNYTVGVEEHSVFPEINPNEVEKLRGMEITIVTTTKNDKYAKSLLDKFGFPFIKNG